MDDRLRAQYLRLLRWYPRRWRRANEEVVLGTLLDNADAHGGEGPTKAEARSLRLDGLAHRLHLSKADPRWIRMTALVGAITLTTVTVSGWPAQSLNAAPALTSAQAAQQLAACLTEKGWTVQVSADEGVEAEFPSDLEDRYTADANDCVERLGLNRPFLPSPAQLASLYTDQLSAQECLRKLGYETAQAPALPVYIVTLGTWSPFEALPNMNSKEWARLERSCPQPQIEQ